MCIITNMFKKTTKLLTAFNKKTVSLIVNEPEYIRNNLVNIFFYNMYMSIDLYATPSPGALPGGPPETEPPIIYIYLVGFDVNEPCEWMLLLVRLECELKEIILL